VGIQWLIRLQGFLSAYQHQYDSQKDRRNIKATASIIHEANLKLRKRIKSKEEELLHSTVAKFSVVSKSITLLA
jgi:hypothetical protein